MTLSSVIAMLLLLLAAVMAIRHRLRFRCLGKCEGCPCARACAAKEAASVQQNQA